MLRAFPQFQGDPEIEIDTERIVMRLEWFGRCAAGDCLQDWGLDLDETALLQETPRFT